MEKRPGHLPKCDLRVNVRSQVQEFHREGISAGIVAEQITFSLQVRHEPVSCCFVDSCLLTDITQRKRDRRCLDGFENSQDLANHAHAGKPGGFVLLWKLGFAGWHSVTSQTDTIFSILEDVANDQLDGVGVSHSETGFYHLNFLIDREIWLRCSCVTISRKNFLSERVNALPILAACFFCNLCPNH